MKCRKNHRVSTLTHLSLLWPRSSTQRSAVKPYATAIAADELAGTAASWGYSKATATTTNSINCNHNTSIIKYHKLRLSVYFERKNVKLAMKLWDIFGYYSTGLWQLQMCCHEKNVLDFHTNASNAMVQVIPTASKQRLNAFLVLRQQKNNLIRKLSYIHPLCSCWYRDPTHRRSRCERKKIKISICSRKKQQTQHEMKYF